MEMFTELQYIRFYKDEGQIQSGGSPSGGNNGDIFYIY